MEPTQLVHRQTIVITVFELVDTDGNVVPVGKGEDGQPVLDLKIQYSFQAFNQDAFFEAYTKIVEVRERIRKEHIECQPTS